MNMRNLFDIGVAKFSAFVMIGNNQDDLFKQDVLHTIFKYKILGRLQ